MTRDGTFLIEYGRVAGGVRNFRFNQSVIEMLSNVEMMGAAVRAAGRRILRDGRAADEGPRLPLQRSDEVLEFRLRYPFFNSLGYKGFGERPWG